MYQRCVLTGPQRKFCEGIVIGLSATDAYSAAYPRSSRSTARCSASKLVRRADIKAEVDRMRDAADKLAGSAVLTLMEKRIFLARIVRAAVASLPENSDLWVSIKRTEDGIEFRLPDKLKAIEIDNDLAGQGSEAGANDALGALLERIMR